MAGRVYLANAFSLNMLPLKVGDVARVCVRSVDAEAWVDDVDYHLRTIGVDCAIGHSATARLVEMLVEMSRGPDYVGVVELRCERKPIKLEPNDILYVIQPRLRLEEGKVLDYKEIVQLLREDKIGFYTVYYGPC